MWQKKQNFIYKEYIFDSFDDGVEFVNNVLDIANRQDHHPKIIIDYKKIIIESTTHSANDVTEKDHSLAEKIDNLIENNIIPKTPPQKHIKEVKLFTDGGSRGNPGPSAIGYAILGQDDGLILKESKYLGITTNNQAEYQGLKEGLEKCRELNFSVVNVFMDSLLVVNQMKGIYKVKNRDLWPVHDYITKFLTNFTSVKFSHVPRELNKLADGMVNECLDNQAG